MDYVRLGRSELVSSVIGLGGGSSGRFGLVKGGTKSDALRLIRVAVDQGITFFDGAGLAGGVDELLGEGLADSRQKVILSTKVHLGFDPTPVTNMRLAHQASAWAARRWGMVCTGPTLRRRIERTLKLVRTDRIDVLHLHAVSPRQYPLVVEKILPELMKMKAEGKLRAIGVTEAFLRDPGHAMLRAAVSDACFDTIMVGFNVSNPSAAEAVLPKAAKADIGVIGMFVLRSLLAPGPAGEETSGARTAGLHRIVGELGISIAELAYRYCRHQPGMHVVLTGTGNPVHLKQNIAAALAPPLPPSVLQRLQVFAAANQADDASTR